MMLGTCLPKGATVVRTREVAMERGQVIDLVEGCLQVTRSE